MALFGRAEAGVRFSIGDEDALEVLVTPEAVRSFTAVSGDDAPLHTDSAYARAHGFEGPIVHGALLAAYVSRIAGRVRQTSEAVASVALDITISAETGGVIATGKTFHRLISTPERA